MSQNLKNTYASDTQRESQNFAANLDNMHLENKSARFQLITQEINKIIIGQDEAITFMLLGILCQGHILLEGVPGVAKTTMIKALNKALGLSFKRIQFTPDLLPADVIGTLIYNPKTQEFETKKGPIFANLILADEINRAPAKVQSALLEAMQEQQVTIGSETFRVDKPFLVFATQNPIEQEGTYRLPEAQVDRFMFKLCIDYPTQEQEKKILRNTQSLENINTILTPADLFTLTESIDVIYCDEKIIDYITNIIFATRTPELFNLNELKKYIACGVSPRATRAFYQACKAYAFLKKRDFVTPDDIKAIAVPIMRHRISLTYEAEAEQISADTVIKIILSKIPTP